MFINNFDPVALEVLSFEIRWYSLSYILGIIIGWYLAKKYFANKNIISKFDDYITYIIIGLIIGGRLGYVFIYDFNYYSHNILETLKIWQGGMSFHGGVLGIIIASIIFAKRNNDNVFYYLDVVALVAPIGIFFGRVANFINSELYGHETSVPWAVKFVQIDNLYRHPSQLYEALSEGIILFLLLLFLRNKEVFKKPGKISSLFLIFYSIFRFSAEYFRVPDNHLGYIVSNLTMGHLISIIFLILGLALYYFINDAKKKL